LERVSFGKKNQVFAHVFLCKDNSQSAVIIFFDTFVKVSLKHLHKPLLLIISKHFFATMKLVKSLSEVNADETLFPIFFHDNYLAVEKETVPNTEPFICFDPQQKIVVPFIVSKNKFLRKAMYIYVPLKIDGKRPDAVCEKIFTEELHHFLKNNNTCDVIFPPYHYCSFMCIPRKCQYYEIGILSIDLTESEEIIFNKINAENRRQIKKAIKAGVEVSWGTKHLNDFYNSYLETVEKKNILADNDSYFKNLLEKFTDDCLIGIARYDNKTEAAVFDVKDHRYAYSFNSGTAHSTAIKGSKKLLVWNEYLQLKNVRIEKYFFGGYRLSLDKSMPLYNVQDFKKNMGCVIEKGYHFIKILNPAKYYLYTATLWCKALVTGKQCSMFNKSGLEIKKST